MTKYLYHVKRLDSGGYDTFSDFVVVARNSTEARLVTPKTWASSDSSWTTFENTKARRVGVASSRLANRTVICASFHAG